MENNKPKFKVVVLGSAGGVEEDNLSSYLIAPVKSDNYAAIDAGTLLSGIKKAVQTGSLSDIDYPHDADLSLEGYILQNNIKAYVLTHAHMDHIAGLIINSPSDTNKNIYATRATIENLKNYVFNWEIWPNFGNEGVGFHIHKYSYITLKPGKETKLSEVALSLMPFSLSHGNGHYPSTAFLIKSNGSYVLFIGDTAPDSIENSENLKSIWAYTAPLIMKKKIRAIFIESSFANERPDHKLYGHLTPKWVIHELTRLAKMVDSENYKDSLKGLPVVITHIKPTLNRNINIKNKIEKQLNKHNNIGIKFIIPNQGDRLEF